MTPRGPRAAPPAGSLSQVTRKRVAGGRGSPRITASVRGGGRRARSLPLSADSLGTCSEQRLPGASGEAVAGLLLGPNPRGALRGAGPAQPLQWCREFRDLQPCSLPGPRRPRLSADPSWSPLPHTGKTTLLLITLVCFSTTEGWGLVSPGAAGPELSSQQEANNP